MRRMILTIAQLALILFSPAQVITKPISGSSLNAYSLDHVDLFSTINNHAALAQIKKRSLGLFGERRYMMEGLNNYLAMGAIQTRSGQVGLELGYFGFSRYNQTRAGLVYAVNMGNRLDAGIQFSYYAIRAPGYGNASAIGFDLATIIHLSEKLHTGMQLSNPAGGKFGKPAKEKLPAIYRSGIGYDASRFFAGLELIKEELLPLYINAGLHYTGVPGIVLKAGISSASATWWMCIAYLWKSMRVEISFAFHPQLGITPGFLLLYESDHETNSKEN